jgi:hypothetical protein
MSAGARTPLPSALLLASLALHGCGRRVPPHLQLKPPTERATVVATIESLQDAVAAMVSRDPLMRAPMILDDDVLEAIEGGAPIRAYGDSIRSLERGDGQVERTLQQLEDEHPGTVGVPLARGYRLRVAENLLAQGDDSEGTLARQLAVTLTPLHSVRVDDTLPRQALEWLCGSRFDPDCIRAYGDRWTAQSWLFDPSLDLGAVATALEQPLYSALGDTPTGRLISSRARGATDTDSESGLLDLERATHLALNRAAADRDSEQAAFADFKAEEAEALGMADPEIELLRTAVEKLTAAAAADDAAGGALIALGAQRIRGGCTHAPCTGIDRVEAISAAQAWGVRPARVAKIWRVIAMKDALDTMDVGHETVLFPTAMVSLVDALLGTGAGPLDLELMRRRVPEPAVWLDLARATGVEGITDWDGAKSALGSHLARLAEEALASVEHESNRELLERIKRRAQP